MYIDITPEAAPRTPGRALAAWGKAGVDFVASGAHLADQVDIPVDPAPRAAHGLATNRAKRRLLAAPALLAHHIHVPRDAAPAAPERALCTRGGKGGHYFVTGGAHSAFQVDITLEPAPRAVDFLSTARAKRRLFATSARLAPHIHISRHTASAAPHSTPGSRGGEGGLFFAAGAAHFADQVNIPLNPAPGAVHFLATNRAKRWLLVTPALLALYIHIPDKAAPAAPERALGAYGGKVGARFAASGAHFASQVDIPLDPAPRAVHNPATARAKRRLLAAPALFVHNIHIPRYTARAAPERLLCTCAGENGAFFAAAGAIGHFFFYRSFFFFFFFFTRNGFLLTPTPITASPRPRSPSPARS
jgi:hypothetical protein